MDTRKIKILLDAFAKRLGLFGVEADLLAYEIVYAYPEELVDIALYWAENGEFPDVDVNGLSVKTAAKVFKTDFSGMMKALNIQFHNRKAFAPLFGAYVRRNQAR